MVSMKKTFIPRHRLSAIALSSLVPEFDEDFALFLSIIADGYVDTATYGRLNHAQVYQEQGVKKVILWRKPIAVQAMVSTNFDYLVQQLVEKKQVPFLGTLQEVEARIERFAKDSNVGQACVELLKSSLIHQPNLAGEQAQE
jgi:hypothetical protein